MALITRPTFEYTVLNGAGLSPFDLLAQMNAMGAQGWELVGMLTIPHFIFKRPLVNLTVTI